jgi:beta-mannanase
MRNAGFTGLFMWNPMIGQGNFGPNAGVESVYPGDNVVDIIGLDLYDGWGYPGGEVIRTAAQQQAQWNSYRDQWDGLTGWRNLAQSHGKPLAFPEWGLQLWNSGGTYVGGGDNPLFVAEMAAWMKNASAFMHAFWEDPGMGVADPDSLPRRRVAAPAARAEFLAAFGY